jgi:hypothetical protein
MVPTAMLVAMRTRNDGISPRFGIIRYDWEASRDSGRLTLAMETLVEVEQVAGQWAIGLEL